MTQILTSQGNDKIYLARNLSTHIQGLLLVMLQPCILSVKIETLLYIPVPLGACLAFPLHDQVGISGLFEGGPERLD